jgi:uncharacterized repeat protein (TIGR01451 family)
MKLKLPLLMLFLFVAIKSFSQVTAYPVPDMVQCSNEIFNLNAQIPAVLGNQDPENHVVSFYTSQAAAEANFNVIATPQAYIGQNMETIYVRVQSLVDDSFDVTSFNLVINSAIVVPEIPDVFSCEGYVLPALAVGNYYTAPGGAGTIIPPGVLINTSVTLYVYAVDVDLMCSGQTDFTITIGLPPAAQPQPLVACDYDGDGFAAFDLTTVVNQILNGMADLTVTFYESGTDAEQAQNPIVDPAAYVNPFAGQGVVLARIESLFNPDCYTITSVFLQVEFCSNNTLSGIVTYDFDGNGCTSADYPAENISVFAVSGNNSYQTFTNAEGQYQFTNLPAGQHTISIMESTAPLNVTPGSHIVSLPGNIENLDFCITTPTPVNDVSVIIVPVTVARPGLPAQYAIVYQNFGNQPATGTVTFGFDNNLMTYAGSTPAMTLAGNSLSFNYNNLLPFQSQMIYVSMLIDIPPVADAGTVLNYSALITPTANDVNQANNIYSLEQVVVNSYDPNDITVHEGAFITTEQAQQDYLTYTIRFQNMGTAEALNVRIANTLEADLNASTFIPVAASHAYRTVREGNEVEFIFDDINLPGAQQNEPLSHGFVTYRIKPKSGIALGDTMQNQAAIYFDFNQPVMTNEVFTTVQAAAGVAENVVKGFSMYPNPASDTVTVQLENMVSADVVINDILGKTVLKAKAEGTEQAIDIAALNSGMYFITVTSEGKSVTKKLMVK